MKPIFELVNELPTEGITIHVLNALDFAIPGEWQNLVGFENTIRTVSRETDQQFVEQIGRRMLVLFNDKSQGYQRAMWLYQTVDNVDSTLAKAALADKIGEKINFLAFLSKITPAADTIQTIDMSLKLVAELAAFCLINGIPGDSIGDFVRSLADYSGESLMRIAALITLDGLIPLGPDFLNRVATSLNDASPKDLEGNKMYKKIEDYIPGENSSKKLGFITESFHSVSGWMANFVADHGITADKALGSISRFVEFSDSKLDYVAAFLDMTTNYYEHTGTQTIARRLVNRAVNEV